MAATRPTLNDKTCCELILRPFSDFSQETIFGIINLLWNPTLYVSDYDMSDMEEFKSIASQLCEILGLNFPTFSESGSDSEINVRKKTWLACAQTFTITTAITGQFCKKGPAGKMTPQGPEFPSSQPYKISLELAVGCLNMARDMASRGHKEWHYYVSLADWNAARRYGDYANPSPASMKCIGILSNIWAQYEEPAIYTYDKTLSQATTKEREWLREQCPVQKPTISCDFSAISYALSTLVPLASPYLPFIKTASPTLATFPSDLSNLIVSYLPTLFNRPTMKPPSNCVAEEKKPSLT